MGFIFAFIGFYILFVFYCGLYLLLLGFIGFYILFGFIFAFIAEICLFSQAREWVCICFYWVLYFIVFYICFYC